MYMNLFDSHVHSDNSHDGEHSITFLCENAVQKNLMGLCITDHYELDLNTEQADLCLRNSFIETGKARQAFDYRLLVMNGIEMGQATQNLDKAEEVLRKYRFDFVLGSLHAIRGMDDFAYVDFSGLNAEVILERYFDELLELCQWGGFDSLAHMTYPLRYIVGKYQQPVEMSYSEVIREILSTLAQKHLGAGDQHRRPAPGDRPDLPDAGICQTLPRAGRRNPDLRLGRALRAGSGRRVGDRHRHGQEAGFSYFAFYKKHEPRMLRLL